MTARRKWKLAQHYEGVWWKKYLKKKGEKYLDFKREYWRNIVSQVPGLKKENAAILDVGCGPSGVYMVLDKHKVTAIDPLVERYEKELSMFSVGHYPWVRFMTEKIEEFASGARFDYIFCMNAINHFQDIKPAMHKLFELLSSQGYLVMTIDVHNHGFLKYLLRYTGLDIMHPYQMMYEDYTSLIEKCGFQVIKNQILKKCFVFNHCFIVAQKIPWKK